MRFVELQILKAVVNRNYEQVVHAVDRHDRHHLYHRKFGMDLTQALVEECVDMDCMAAEAELVVVVVCEEEEAIK